MSKSLYIWNLAYSVTNSCNLRCKHCYASAGHSLEGELDIRQIEEHIIEPAVGVGTKFITFTGGEPFVRKDFLEIVETTKSHGIGVSIATNGLLLNEAMIAQLKTRHVDRIQISLEGSSAEVNDDIRGVGVFARLTEQVIPQLLDAGLFVAISFTPTARNGFDVAGMAGLCSRLGVPSLSIRRYSDTGRAKENALSMSRNHARDLAETVYRLKKEYDGVLAISSGDPICILSHPHIDKFVNGEYLSGCTAGITSLAIDPIGNIKPCTRAELVIGNVLIDDLGLVWNENEVLAKLRDRNNLSGKCGRCKFKMLCGGCRVAALNRYNDILGEDDQCWMV